MLFILQSSREQHNTPPDSKNSKPVILSIAEKRYELRGHKLWINKEGKITTDIDINLAPAPEQIVYLTVPPGKIYEVEFSEKTVLFANSETSIKFPIIFGNTREISVQGEAQLQVMPDETRLFIVNLGPVQVKTLGSKLNVNTYSPDEQIVAICSGKAELIGCNKNVTLSGGEKATFIRNRFSMRPFISDELNWAQGRIILNDANEKQVEKAFARYFDKIIVFPAWLNGFKMHLTLDRNYPVSILVQQLPGGFTIEEKGDTTYLK